MLPNFYPVPNEVSINHYKPIFLGLPSLHIPVHSLIIDGGRTNSDRGRKEINYRNTWRHLDDKNREGYFRSVFWEAERAKVRNTVTMIEKMRSSGWQKGMKLRMT